VLPFPIRKLQYDNGTEFPLAFRLAVEANGIRRRYIQPRTPEQSGTVERSHRIDDEFWSRHEFATLHEAEPHLREWERACNHERFSWALAGQTPFEKPMASFGPPTVGPSPPPQPIDSVSQHAPFIQKRGRAQRMAKGAR
jgi:transposase InsO family protein